MDRTKTKMKQKKKTRIRGTWNVWSRSEKFFTFLNSNAHKHVCNWLGQHYGRQLSMILHNVLCILSSSLGTHRSAIWVIYFMCVRTKLSIFLHLAKLNDLELNWSLALRSNNWADDDVDDNDAVAFRPKQIFATNETPHNKRIIGERTEISTHTCYHYLINCTLCHRMCVFGPISFHVFLCTHSQSQSQQHITQHGKQHLSHIRSLHFVSSGEFTSPFVILILVCHTNISQKHSHQMRWRFRVERSGRVVLIFRVNEWATLSVL